MMGQYTALALKGIVKKEFRSFTSAFVWGNWASVPDPKFQEFAKVPRADFIPCGYSAYFDDDYCTFCNVDCEQSHPIYNEETGEWQVYCSLKDYDNTIRDFLMFLPYFMESCDLICTRFNGWDSPVSSFKLINKEVVFIKCSPFED